MTTITETQDNLEISYVKCYPLYGGGQLIVGQVTKHKGMIAGIDPPYCRLDIPNDDTYPSEWFPITEFRSMYLLIKLLDEKASLNGFCIPEMILLDCYRFAWERLKYLNKK